MDELEEILAEIIEPHLPKIIKLVKNHLLEDIILIVMSKIAQLTQKKELSGDIYLDAEKIKTECFKEIIGD